MCSPINRSTTCCVLPWARGSILSGNVGIRTLEVGEARQLELDCCLQKSRDARKTGWRTSNGRSCQRSVYFDLHPCRVEQSGKAQRKCMRADRARGGAIARSSDASQGQGRPRSAAEHAERRGIHRRRGIARGDRQARASNLFTADKEADVARGLRNSSFHTR